MENFELHRKDFRILIVEDEEFARLQLGKFFKRIINNVELCENGFEGFLKFQELYNKDEKFDLIISDINMPKLDGLEMLEKIREIDKDVPTVFLTARNEPEKIIKAVSLHVSDYILKPLDLGILNEKITKITKEIYYKKIYEKQKAELDHYIEILENEALVRKMDLEGNITFVNDGFCKISAYEKEELLGKHFSETIHSDISSEFINELWETVNKGKNWTGKYKCLSKDDTVYFLNSKLIPIYDLHRKNIIELMFIEFSITDEEVKNREKHKNYITQVLEYKKTISELKNEILNIRKQEKAIKEQETYLEEKNISNTKKIKQLLSQLESYEKNKLEYDKMDLVVKKGKNEQFEKIRNTLRINEVKNKKLEKETEEYKNRLEEKNSIIENHKKTEEEHIKRINGLKDLVSNLQKENKENKDKKSLFGLG